MSVDIGFYFHFFDLDDMLRFFAFFLSFGLVIAVFTVIDDFTDWGLGRGGAISTRSRPSRVAS